ncbi:MAG: hypothetical protein F6K24_31855 [Okeania sp. SIO2D1]|nr:hypothetical protein [Okeania sp. SIO2D1]
MNIRTYDWEVPTDNNGTGLGPADALNATLNLTATGSNGQVATTTFTDSFPASAPSLTEIGEYLVIAMGDDGDVGRAFQMSNSEIGANRDVLSNSSDPDFSITDGGFPNLLDVFQDRSSSGTRWDTSTNPNTVSVSDDGNLEVVSPGEVIDYSGEVALTSDNGRFDFSNSLVFADVGIQGVTNNPAQGTSNSFHADIGETTQGTSDSLGLNSGATGGNNFSSLLTELNDWKTFIEGLSAEETITNLSPFQNNEARDGVIQGTPGNGLVTTYDASDETNNDGIVVIDINLGGSDFDLTNLDWAIVADDGVVPIFRLRNGSNMLMSNVSILVDNDDGSDLGALFYSGYEGSSSGDTVFSGDNIVLNGVGLWDLNEVGEGGGDIKTQITINNGQGCAHFISQKVDFQNNRWTHCVPGVEQPDILDFGDLQDTN